MSIYEMNPNMPLTKGTIALRDDLSLLVSVGDQAIELNLDADTARDLAVALLAKLMALRPDIAPRLADELWQLATAHLSDQQAAAIVDPRPGHLEPLATR